MFVRNRIAIRITIMALLFIILISPAFSLDSNERQSQPIEIGIVNWLRDFDKALALAKESKKPLFALFQEVPGCSGCKTFGQVVLSQPLIVEAIESEFVPVVIYNNRGGEDAKLLKRYNEPAWNYQVIRFLDEDGKDIISRKDKIWSVTAVAKRMKQALSAHSKPIPAYIEGLAVDLDSKQVGQVLFSQHCFWTGEQKLGGLPEVIKTEAGFYDGREVTRVWYDKNKTSLTSLTKKAQMLKVADGVYSSFKENQYRTAPDSDQKKQIQNTAFAKLDLYDFQTTKVNAFARTNRKAALSFLSPRQRKGLNIN